MPPAVTPTAASAVQDVTLLSRFEPWMLMVMALSALAALLICLLMIYMYINNIRTTEFDRQMLLDAVTDFQFRKRMGQVNRPQYSPILVPERSTLLLIGFVC